MNKNKSHDSGFYDRSGLLTDQGRAAVENILSPYPRTELKQEDILELNKSRVSEEIARTAAGAENKLRAKSTEAKSKLATDLYSHLARIAGERAIESEFGDDLPAHYTENDSWHDKHMRESYNSRRLAFMRNTELTLQKAGKDRAEFFAEHGYGDMDGFMKAHFEFDPYALEDTEKDRQRVLDLLSPEEAENAREGLARQDAEKDTHERWQVQDGW